MKATRQLCAACGAEITRSTGLALCASCGVLAHDAFEAAHRGADPTIRQRAWFEYFGGRSAPAIEAARQARAVAV